MKLKDIYRCKWTRLAFWGVLYLLWVIWLGNYWWLIGLGVVFDMTVTGKVNWTFWKPRDKAKRNKFTEWVDAIIFAVIVVTFINIFFFQSFKIPSSSMESSLMTGDHLFVSKLAYGPRMPQTPLTIPFTHNVIGSRESYSTLIQNDYKRLKGFGRVERFDPVVFGFPDGDTVLVKAPADDYYAICRRIGRKNAIRTFGPVKVRPMDKVDHYVKRCVALPGDSLLIENGVLFVNGAAAPVYQKQQTSYTVTTTGSKISSRVMSDLKLNEAEIIWNGIVGEYPELNMTAAQAEQISALSNVVSVKANVDVYSPEFSEFSMEIFPFSEDYHWTRDNFGPLWIPSAGATVKLDSLNLPLYERIITDYEGHSLSVCDDGILIDGCRAESYTFAQDYYFMMGDNRHNSLDSRYWGFVPEDHIVGKPALVWLSLDPSKKFPGNIRWDRFFKTDFSM